MAEQRYKIYEKLGAGGVGAVFRAYDTQLKRWVAIKRLLSAAEANSADPEATELRREADTLASMRNPNIVTIFDVGGDAEGLYIVMELLEGEDLSDMLARGPLSYDDFKELANQALEGLLTAHQNHILHRDIKPENIKVERLPGGRFQSKIIDFGLARAGKTARKQTEDQAGTVMGSIFYMAPEQLTRQPVDVRTDLYSLGAVFYEALSGKKAFDGDTMTAVMDAHLDHKVTPLHVVAPWVPPWLSAWVLRLLAFTPDDRPADARQAIEEFRAWEKMPSVPVGPWMPMAYYPPYGTQYPQQDSAAQYAQPVAVDPEPEPVAVIVEPEAPPRGPQRKSHSVRPPTASVKLATGVVRPGTGAVHTHGESGTVKNRGKGRLLIISGSVIALGFIAWFVFGRDKGTSDSGGRAGDGIAASGPPKVKFELPAERLFPLPADAICVHLVSNVGTRTGGDADAKTNEALLEWHDLSPFGQDNFLRSFNAAAEYSPRLIDWPTENTGVKPGRKAIDFRLRSGTPSAMNLTDPEQESGAFPFGTVTKSGPLNFARGATVVVAFQASSADLPTRVVTLTGEDASLSLRVDEQRNIIAEAQSSDGKKVEIVSSGIDGSFGSVAIISWKGDTGEMQLRARDGSGKTYRAAPSNAPPPAKPLSKLQLGRVLDPQGNPVSKADCFSGVISELIVFSTALQDNQMDVNEKQLGDFYLVGAPKAQLPPLQARLKNKLPLVENPKAWKITASGRGNETKNVVDGNSNTRWTSGAPQKPGQFIQVELPAEENIAGVALEAANMPQDYPRGIRVELSVDGKVWKPTTAADGKQGLFEIILPQPQKARFIKIVQTGEASASWSISELALLKK